MFARVRDTRSKTNIGYLAKSSYDTFVRPRSFLDIARNGSANNTRPLPEFSSAVALDTRLLTEYASNQSGTGRV